MKIAYIAAGAANMICGSCLRDNAVAGALLAMGEDVTLIPLYTPLRVDRENFTNAPVRFGGVSIYFQQTFGLFRKTALFDRVFNSRPALALAGRFAGSTRASDLGPLTVSTILGEDGNQRREVERLAEWMAAEIRPDVINLPNSMFCGVARLLREKTGSPVICSLTGEDLFLSELVEPWKTRAIEALRKKAQDVDGFIAISHAYADHMAQLLDVARDKIHVVPIGLDLDGYGRRTPREAGPSGSPEPGRPFTIGYLARIAPEKGLHVLAEAFALLRKMPGTGDARLHVAGWLGKRDRAYLSEIQSKLRDGGLADSFSYVGEVTFEQKLEFLDSLDVLSVPTVYRDPKGLFVLEALAHGVPVVQPAHGAFPELIEATGGGWLIAPDSPEALADGLHAAARDRTEADRRAEAGRAAVAECFTARHMAEATLEVYGRYVRD